MFKEDLQGSSAELLFGQCLRLPGDLISPTHENQNASSSDIINSMRAFTESLHPTSTRVEQKKSIFLPKTLNDSVAYAEICKGGGVWSRKCDCSQ